MTYPQHSGPPFPQQSGPPYQQPHSAPPYGYQPQTGPMFPPQPAGPYGQQPPTGTFGYPAQPPQPAPRKRSTGVTVAVVCGAVVLLCCGGVAVVGGLSGSGKNATSTSGGDTGAAQAVAEEVESPTPKPTAATVPIGTSITVPGILTSAKVTVTKLRSSVGSGNQFITPDRGQFVVIDVTIEAVKGKIHPHQGDFKLVGPDGSVYESEFLSAAKPELEYTELAPGQKTSGTITFDAPKGAHKGAKVALKEFWSSGDAGYWQAP